MFSRLTAGGPTAEPDGAIIGNFYTADTSANYGAGNETAYASNVMKLTYFSNSYSGFSVGVGYTPNTVAEQDDAQATTITNGVAESFSDIKHQALLVPFEVFFKQSSNHSCAAWV